jgi:hypothetical protein
VLHAVLRTKLSVYRLFAEDKGLHKLSVQCLRHDSVYDGVRLV